MKKKIKYAILISIFFVGQLFINEKMAFSIVKPEIRLNKKIQKMAILYFADSEDIKFDDNLIRENIANKLKINILSQKEMDDIEKANNILRPEFSTLNEQIKDYGDYLNVDFLIAITIIGSNNEIKIVINFYPFNDFPEIESIFYLNKFSIKKFNQRGNKKLSDLIINRLNFSDDNNNRKLYVFVAAFIAVNYVINEAYNGQKGKKNNNKLPNPPNFPY